MGNNCQVVLYDIIYTSQRYGKHLNNITSDTIPLSFYVRKAYYYYTLYIFYYLFRLLYLGPR